MVILAFSVEINHFLGYNRDRQSMEIDQSKKDKFKPKANTKSQYLHSQSHLLADELSSKFGEPKRFGFYLKIALNNDHNVLRRIAGEVLEGNKAKKPGALFAFLVKKERTQNTQTNEPKN